MLPLLMLPLEVEDVPLLMPPPLVEALSPPPLLQAPSARAAASAQARGVMRIGLMGCSFADMVRLARAVPTPASKRATACSMRHA
jgi:hypothetical protein